MAWPDGIGEAVRGIPAIGFILLAGFFGLSLLPGRTPLIEQIARVGKPDLTQALVRYTRWLTALWSLWMFLLAVSVTMNRGSILELTGYAWIGSLLLFTGEYLLRRWFFFPDESFPGLLQQVRDTVHVWRPSGRR